MSWAEAKKINSDMTVPIDTLLKNSVYLAASNELTLLPIIEEQFTMSSSLQQIGQEFVVNMDGYIRIYLSAGITSSTDSTMNFDLRVVKNGSATDYNIIGTEVCAEKEDFWRDISIKKGDVIKLYVSEGRVYTQVIYTCSIMGSVIFSPLGEPVTLTNEEA